MKEKYIINLEGLSTSNVKISEEEYKKYREHKERYLTGKVKYWHPLTGDPLDEPYKEVKN